ncbi:unnamed protein product [Ectocarpus sp. CCAP 1310/34]|nr:unnamed protein product [Ectocarpus sp. CCAP 1310/34]
MQLPSSSVTTSSRGWRNATVRSGSALSRLARFRAFGDNIQGLRASIKAVVPIMGLAGVVNLDEKLEKVLARLQPRPQLAPVPEGIPVRQSWPAVRHGVEDRVCRILGGGRRPAVAALTGRSGTGKTTSAAAVLRERGPIHPRAGETEDMARTRLDRGEGDENRSPSLMHTLAKARYEDVMEKRVDTPAAGEDGESYVNKFVSRESLRYLVVADDVREVEVVEKLRKTGMWVLLTTRIASMVEPNERVLVDQLTQEEAEDVLRGAAGLPVGYRLCDDAMKVLEICGLRAMDIAFVGSWSSVRTADNGAPIDSRA